MGADCLGYREWGMGEWGIGVRREVGGSITVGARLHVSPPPPAVTRRYHARGH
jgi:hypothetical protein